MLSGFYYGVADSIGAKSRHLGSSGSKANLSCFHFELGLVAFV